MAISASKEDEWRRMDLDDFLDETKKKLLKIKV